MESVVLTRPIRIIVVMTGDFRERFIQEARTQIAQIEENLSRLESTTPPDGAGQSEAEARQVEMIRQQIEAEKARLARRRGEIQWRIKEVEAVPDGSELPYRSYEGPVEIRQGDDFLDRMAEAEVVLKDWKVVQIRLAGGQESA